MLRKGISLSALVLAAGSALGQVTGPSTTTSPYMLPAGPNAAQVQTVSIFTVGDIIGGYRMVGIPDGLGAMSNGNGTFDLFMNHELGATVGAVRAHGQTGAFVSRWNISNNLTVNSGRDHNQAGTDINTWTAGAYVNGATAYGRLCSADLPAPSAFKFGNLGTDARIFMNGEEVGHEGRAFGHVVSGPNTNQSWELPRLGKFSWENSVANPKAQQKTIVMGTDDSTPGQVYMYVGNKQAAGNDVERAGLTNGTLYGVRVAGTPNELRAAPPAAATPFSLFNEGNVENMTGAALNAQSNANNVTSFLRPEDGAWDARPGHENNFYFVTTDAFNSNGFNGRSRLWQMTFNDISNPELGGDLTCLMDGTQGQQMFDNMTIDSLGRILLQEDPGNQGHLAKVWLYDIASKNYAIVAQADSSRFLIGGSNYLGTQDEESSGIIDAKDTLGLGWFLMDTQAHYGIPGELVEGGQLMAFYVDPSVVPAPGSIALLGLAGIVGGRRRR